MRKKNGHGKKRTHEDTVKARKRIMREAKRAGIISNERARKIGGFGQVWYHLNTLCEAGLLKHAGYNLWAPVKRRGRPRAVA